MGGNYREDYFSDGKPMNPDPPGPPEPPEKGEEEKGWWIFRPLSEWGKGVPEEEPKDTGPGPSMDDEYPGYTRGSSGRD